MKLINVEVGSCRTIATAVSRRSKKVEGLCLHVRKWTLVPNLRQDIGRELHSPRTSSMRTTATPWLPRWTTSDDLKSAMVRGAIVRSVANRLIKKIPYGPPIGASRIQLPIKAAYYRGGTSRALIIQPQDLPPDRTRWNGIFRQLIGSPDPYGRQLDGMGAGISSLSKICLVERTCTKTVTGSYRSNTIDYTFVGMGIETDEVDVTGNCGNMSAAIGPYAYNAGLLPPQCYTEPNTQISVVIRNTNTKRTIKSTFDVVNYQAAVTGDYSMDGVSGTGSKVELDFTAPMGSKTGKLFPTGNKVDTILGYSVTCIDGANPFVFVRADHVDIDGTILPNDFNALPGKLTLLEKIRKAAAVAMGLAKTEDSVARTVPKIGIVSMPTTHAVLSGKTVKSAQVDIVIRFISDTQPHRAIPLTAALTSAVAAKIQGTIVEQIIGPEPVTEGLLTIGHASGTVEVKATMDPLKPQRPRSATVFRTAKRIFEGDVFYTENIRHVLESLSTEALGAKFQEAKGAGYQHFSEPHSLGMAFVLEQGGKDSSELFTSVPKEQTVTHFKKTTARFRKVGVRGVAVE